MTKGITVTYTFSAYSLMRKHITDALIEEKLVRKGFELDEHMTVERHEDGSVTYRQFLASPKMYNAEDSR